MTLAVRPRRRRQSAGFTMIEVMVSMLLTAIATSGIIALYVVETRASGFSRHTTEATVLAQDEMERLRTSSVLAALPVTTINLNEHGQVVANGLFSRAYTVVAGPASPTGSIDFDDMTVIVTWLEDEYPRSVVLESRRNR